MIDLIYDRAAWPEIKKAIPSATMEDASDYIHTDRIQVTIPDEEKDTYYKAAIVEGYSDVSLGFQFMLMAPEHQETIRKWCDELKAEKSRKSDER